jgi:hypothetical protein
MTIPTKDGREPARRLPGALRTERIRKIAAGEDYQAIADEEEVSLDAIYQFASRNKEEIRLAKQALVADPNDEYAGVAIAKKLNRIADTNQDLADVIELLSDPDLTPTQRKGFLGLKSKLRREVAEEKGELPVRSHLELNVRGNPFANIDAVVIDDDGSLHPLR